MHGLTKAAIRVLTWLRDHEHNDDLVCDRLECWYGENRTTRQVVNQLLRVCFISPDSIPSGSEHYHINESGRRALDGLPPYRDAEGQWHETLMFMYSGK